MNVAPYIDPRENEQKTRHETDLAGDRLTDQPRASDRWDELAIVSAILCDPKRPP